MSDFFYKNNGRGKQKQSSSIILVISTSKTAKINGFTEEKTKEKMVRQERGERSYKAITENPGRPVEEMDSMEIPLKTKSKSLKIKHPKLFPIPLRPLSRPYANSMVRIRLSAMDAFQERKSVGLRCKHLLNRTQHGLVYDN